MSEPQTIFHMHPFFSVLKKIVTIHDARLKKEFTTGILVLHTSSLMKSTYPTGTPACPKLKTEATEVMLILHIPSLIQTTYRKRTAVARTRQLFMLQALSQVI
jgi:hypothetical protein